MKKKIINGILMVALLAATSTSFVSCKDNTEDVSTDLRGYIDTQKTILQGEIDDTNAALSALATRVGNNETAIQNLQGDVTTLKGNVQDLDTRLTNCQNQVNGLDEAINGENGIKDQIADIKTELTSINGEIDNIKDALTNLITSVTVNATSTSILQNSKLFPGLNMQFLGAAYGEAKQPGEFPSTDAADYVEGHGVVLTAKEIASADAFSWKKNDIINSNKGNAGKLYFTVNPSNIDVLNSDIELSLVNSQNEESIVKLEDIDQDTETVLTWGTRGDNDPKLYVATATMDFGEDEIPAAIKDATIDPTKIIDYSAVVEEVKTIVKEAKEAAKTVANDRSVDAAQSALTTNGKSVLKASAQIVANLLEAKIPAMPALALKTTWTDFVGERSVLSDYSIAATAYKPLSFQAGKGVGANLPTVSVDVLDEAVAKVVAYVTKKLAKIDSKLAINLNGITYSATGFNVNQNAVLWYEVDGGIVINVAIKQGAGATTAPAATTLTSAWNNGGNFTITENFNDDIDTMITAVNNGIPFSEIQSLIQQASNLIANVQHYANRTQTLTDRVSKYLEDHINKYIGILAEDGLTRVLEPILLMQNGNGVARFTASSYLEAGEYDLIPTTVTHELLAPAYKKYVAVINNKTGNIEKAWNLTKGDKEFSNFSHTFTTGDYTVVYAALDFYGKAIAKRYTVTVK